LDDQGWVAISELVLALQSKGILAVESEIFEMVTSSEKKRHQIDNGRIRAYYGHSVEQKIVKQPTEPPEFLYHGTVETNLSSILERGLLPMDRQYVHLSADEETAYIVGSRRKGEVAILKIKAAEAFLKQINFYREENGIWLADPIPPIYILQLPKK
jgi:putative RNA 2'-phosphotransferase